MNEKLGPYSVNSIVCDDCLSVMRRMPSECVDLVVTSPPYFAQKSYELGLWADTNAYYAFISSALAELYRIAKPSLRLCWQVALTISNKGTRHSPAFESYGIAMKAGWLYRDMAIWIPTSGKKDFRRNASTAWGSWKSPSNPCLRSGNEAVMIFDKLAHKREDVTSDITAQEFNFWTISNWYIPQDKGMRKLHEAPFPIELATRCLKLFGSVSDIIFDPFIGSGTTAVAADRLGRGFFGCDINPNYVKVALKRLKDDRESRAQLPLQI